MMSIRFPKAGFGAFGFIVLLTGILFLFSGATNHNPVAAQDNQIPTPTPTATPLPNVTIIGQTITIGDDLFLNQDVLIQPLRLICDDTPISSANVLSVEMFGGESLKGQINDIGILVELCERTQQTIRFVFSIETNGNIYTAGLGSLLPLGTVIDSNTNIEITVSPQGILAEIQLPNSLQSPKSQPFRTDNINQPSAIHPTPAVTESDNQIIKVGAQRDYDLLVIAQGVGGETIVNIRNFDPNNGPLTSVKQAFAGAAGRFEEKIGGGTGRATYLSTGDLDNDGSPDIVLSFGPVTRDATFPNIVVVRNAETRAVVGHSFVAFPNGEDSEVNYNGGEIRTAVGDFTGTGMDQLAVVQGQGGHGLVRLYQYTGNPAPNGWEVVGQFYGLPPNLVLQEKGAARIGLTLGAGDLDNDGRDELLVGQTNGPSSQTIFHVLDINDQGGIENRHPYAGFKTQFRGNGGIELCAADLNGDGQREIIVASMGNLKNFGDARDTVPLNLVSIIVPILNGNQITGFTRPGGRSVFNAFTDDVNPSGAISITAGEFDGNADNGKEIVVGTGAVIEKTGFELSLRKTAPLARYRFLKVEYDGERVSNITSWMGPGEGFTGFVDKANPQSGAVFLGTLEISDKVKPIQPKPPTTLTMGEFTLTVDSYDDYTWTNSFSTVVDASGTAWTEFDCNNPFIIGTIIGVAELAPITLEVVAEVQNPQTQIALKEALEFDGFIRPGQNLTIYLPKDEITRSKPLIANELIDRYHFDREWLGELTVKKGQIKVHFSNCEIQVDPTDSTKGTIGSGRACYPTKDPYPDRVKLTTAGFRTYLDSLCITPSSATAEAELEFPHAITNGSDCRAAYFDLGEITITQDCQYHKSFADEGFGTWGVSNTGMEIFGVGFIADFSKTWSYSGTPSLTNEWRGVVLITGETVPGNPDYTFSNYGYIKARYGFSNALVTATGLTTELSLIDSFHFSSLQPLDYTLYLYHGGLSMTDCEITGGSFTNGRIILPPAAVRDPSNQPIRADYATLTVQEDMDLYSDSLTVTQDFKWGELSRTSPEQYAYQADRPEESYFYLSATLQRAYWPLVGDIFTNPVLYGDMAAQLETQGIQGLTCLNLLNFEALTPDTPGRNSIRFKYTDRSWMNVLSKGAHAWFRLESFENPVELGPTHESYYEGIDHDGKNVPFETYLAIDYKQERMAEFKFVDSALYENDLSGEVNLEGPTKAKVPFQELQFTSTAHIAGARIVLSTPVPLDYWGVNLVQNPYQDTAGVMCVKTGQIFLTGSGIEEKRHFAQPFWLTWGEILSSGQLDEMKFDYNSSGQKFDGFPFVADGIGLSPWTMADDTDKKKAYLQAGGEVFFDFFGSIYSNVQDYNDFVSSATPPNFGRVVRLSDGTDFGTSPSETNINRMWGNSFGAFDYDIGYDSADQDGYVGEGVMQFFDLVDGPLASSIVLSSTRICMQVHSATEDERHDFTVGPVAHFGQMTRTTGCACVVDGQVERVHLSAELENAFNANIALRAASYSNLEFDLTPSTWDLWVYGNMYLSLLAGSDIEVTGEAHFAVNRDDAYVEGDVSGSIETTSLLGGGLTAEGRLEWHLGAPISGDSYQSLQGRLALELIAPIGSSGCEGGFYVGINAPKDRAWTLADAGGRYSLNPNLLPDRLTGVYGYIRKSASVNLYIVSGGYEVYAGLGAFVDVGGNSSTGIEAISAGVPHLVTNLGLRVWGKILGGLVSASASGNLQLMVGPPPDPFGFQGSLNLEACVLWVFCGDVDVHCGLNSNEGFYLR